MKLITLIILILGLNVGFAQNTYLKITKSSADNDYVMYPPGTEFELKNKHGYIVFKNSEEPGILEITEEHTLYVFPDWKDDVDVYRLTEGRVEKLLTSKFGRSSTYHPTPEENKNAITADFNVTDSNERPGKKNLFFELSNGITFVYEDDVYRAYVNDLNNYIRIEGKYVMDTDLGVLKISFNENNGRTWWVFEPKK